MIVKLRTNESERYVRASEAELKKAMYAYIRAKRKAGFPLAWIVFTWTPIHISKL